MHKEIVCLYVAVGFFFIYKFIFLSRFGSFYATIVSVKSR